MMHRSRRKNLWGH